MTMWKAITDVLFSSNALASSPEDRPKRGRPVKYTTLAEVRAGAKASRERTRARQLGGGGSPIFPMNVNETRTVKRGRPRLDISDEERAARKNEQRNAYRERNRETINAKQREKAKGNYEPDIEKRRAKWREYAATYKARKLALAESNK
jgi:hypothetical protein